MALQKINWTQIDTAVVPSGTTIDLGAISGPLHAVYAENLYISGQSIGDFVSDSGTNELNLFSASVKSALEFTGSNLTVKGNLLVKGTTTSINSNVVTIGDNVLELNGSESTFGGLLIKDPTNPNKISGSLLWDTTNDYWIAGQLGQEEKVILQSDLDSSSIWQETGSFWATTNDLQVTGSMVIRGDLRVEGTTTLVQKLDQNAQSLIISGAASIVRNEFMSASLSIQNLGTLADRSMNSVIDCGDGFF